MDEHRRGGSCGKAVKGISVVSKGERGSSVGAERRKKQAIAAKDMLVIPTQPISSTENIIPFTPLHPPPHPNNKNTPTGRAHLLRFNHLNRSPALFQPAPLSPPPAIPLTLTTSLHLPPHPPQPPPSPFASDRIYQTIKKSPRIHFSHDTNDKTASNSSSQIWKDCSAELRKGVIFGSSSVLIRVNEVPREGGCSPRRRLLEDAVSIVSHETGTVTESQICVDESILISREIDSFQAVSSRKLLPHCTMWLARERRIGWLVALKVFSGPQEPHAHHELSLLKKLNGEDPCSLQIYQTLVEGGR